MSLQYPLIEKLIGFIRRLETGKSEKNRKERKNINQSKKDMRLSSNLMISDWWAKITGWPTKFFKPKFGFIPGFFITWIIFAAALFCILSILYILINVILMIIKLEPIKFAIVFFQRGKYWVAGLITFLALMASLAHWISARHKDWL